jgi:hypothetical protein
VHRVDIEFTEKRESLCILLCALYTSPADSVTLRSPPKIVDVP